MHIQSNASFTFRAPSRPGGNVTDANKSEKSDFDEMVTLSAVFQDSSRIGGGKLLENEEIDICNPVFWDANREHEGHNDAITQARPHNCSATTVGGGRMSENDSGRYRSGRDDQTEGAEMRKSCLSCFDSDGMEGSATPKSARENSFTVKEIISPDIVCHETTLLSEAKRLREKHKGASSPRAVWVGAELLRIAIAAATSG